MDGRAPLVQGDPIAPVILGVTTILAFAILGRMGARTLGQPTVLGELIMGIVLGSMAKGLVAGVVIGYVAKKVESLAIGIVAGIVTVKVLMKAWPMPSAKITLR